MSRNDTSRVAERTGTGLQHLSRRFESDHGVTNTNPIKNSSCIFMVSFFMLC